MTSQTDKHDKKDAPHIPVMLPEVLDALAPKSGETHIDGTFGAGGYTSAILESCTCNVIGFDRDPSAIKTAQKMATTFDGRLKPIHSDFGDMLNQCRTHGFEKIDGIVLDLGVSSMQLDQAQRGFSFQKDGPLDMRMDDSEESEIETAAEMIDRISQDNLANVIYNYGDERKSRRIARAIKTENAIAPITTTLRLAEIVAKANPQSPKIKTHPATKTFQALRIAVNDELGQLEKALDASLSLLKEGGRLVVVTFHSLEDRIVKQFMREHSGLSTSGSRYLPEAAMQPAAQDAPLLTIMTRKAVLASDNEIATNARSRSAKLRAAIRTDAPYAPSEDGRHGK